MSKALAAYEEKYSKLPKDAATLVAFAKQTTGVKPVSENDAKKAISAAKKKKKEEKDKKKSDKKDGKKDSKDKKDGKKADKKDGEKKGKKDEKKDSKEKKDKKDEKKDDEKKEDKKEDKKDAKPKVKKSKFRVNDEVLLSKDRMGTIRYVGPIPELGEGTWFGVELTDGSIGQTDGAVKGKRYFTTGAKRALFVPLMKIRRKLNTRDHQRQDSLKALQTGVTHLKNAYRSDTGEDENKENGVPSVPENEPAPDAEEEAAPDTKDEPEAPAEEEPKDEDKEDDDDSSSSSSDDKYNGIGPAVGINVLAFILAQEGKARKELLDIYCNKKKHAVLVSAYGHVKELEEEQQAAAWKEILGRLD